jgi:hypothetical protein
MLDFTDNERSSWNEGRNMDAVDVSVIISVRHSVDTTLSCLAHLENQSFPAGRFEVIIVEEGDLPSGSASLARYASGAPIRTRFVGGTHLRAAEARNMAVQESQGRWLLFLNEDLLAGTHLIERHVQVQEQHGGRIAVIGSVTNHPQMRGPDLRLQMLPEGNKPLSEGSPLSFLEWRGANMSLPRTLFLEEGGFDKSYRYPHGFDSELAWRLSQKGIEAFYDEKACAYLWKELIFEEVRFQYWEKGYSLHLLEQHTRSPEIGKCYTLSRTPLRQALEPLLMPFYLSACRRAHASGRGSHKLCHRIFRRDIYQGYLAARKVLAT